MRLRWAVLALAIVSFAGAAAVSLETGLPRPGVHDEFCYLLAGDTFARFRLTNPTHPLWKHFESFHLFHEPTYSSKYPPAQGLFLAVGIWLGHPAVGVWLSAAAMSAALVWMLWAWLPPPWALFAGVLATLKFGISGTWAQSYIGGAVIVIGGALLYGGLRRLFDEPRAGHAVWMSVGLVVLANSRPYEGLILSLPAAVMLLVWLLRRQGPTLGRRVKVAVLPIALVLAAGAVWTTTHNRAVTGDPLRLPYMVHHEAYPFNSMFVWQKAPIGTQYRHWVFRDFEKRHRWSLMQGNPPGVRLRALKKRFRNLREEYLPGLLWLPLVFLPLALRDYWTIAAIAVGVFFLAGQIMTISVLPHYSAPATWLLFFLIVQSIRSSSRVPRVGERLSLAVAGIVVVLFAYNTVAQARTDNSGSWVQIHRERPAIETRLGNLGGRHVVIVRYGPGHNVHNEWVYNSAEIDGQNVIWAQDRGDILNRLLMDYYSDRQVWLLRLGFDPEFADDLSLEPYQPSSQVSIGRMELDEVLEMMQRGVESDVRKAVLGAILEDRVEGRRIVGAEEVFAIGVHEDFWTRGDRPAAVALFNLQSEAARPILILECEGGGELPVTVTVDDGKKRRELVFNRPGRKTIRLRRIPGQRGRLLVLSTDKAWRYKGRGSRWLGAKIVDVRFEPVGIA